MHADDPRVLAVAAALVGLVDALASERRDGGPDDLVPLVDAARLAATSVRTVRYAIRSGDLPAYGRQRDRSVRRADLARWVEERRVRVEGVDDADIERRMRRLRLVGGGAP